jgi:N-carbamoylputrescine amidase
MADPSSPIEFEDVPLDEARRMGRGPRMEPILHDTKGQLRPVKIAMAQIFSLDGDREGNFRRIENAIEEAKEKGADIVTFPESCILGWLNSQAHQRAHTVPGEDSDRLGTLARQYNIHISIGLDAKEGDKLYGTALLLDNTGKIILMHRKIHVLPELMTPSYSVGESIQVVETMFGKIGVLIWADSFLEDLLTKMHEKKPDLLLIPYGWAADEREWPVHGKDLEQVVQNAARKVGCPVIGTDLVGQVSDGPWRGKVYGGHSVAADAEGHILAHSKDRDRDITIVSIVRFSPESVPPSKTSLP